MMSANDIEVHSVLETHERGVNWCDFHPEIDMIVSGADDRKIKLWKYNESRAWDHDSLYGHKNNVSSVVFHPKLSKQSKIFLEIFKNFTKIKILVLNAFFLND